MNLHSKLFILLSMSLATPRCGGQVGARPRTTEHPEHANTLLPRHKHWYAQGLQTGPIFKGQGEDDGAGPTPDKHHPSPDHLRYCSSLTCSIQSTTLPSSAS